MSNSVNFHKVLIAHLCEQHQLSTKGEYRQPPRCPPAFSCPRPPPTPPRQPPAWLPGERLILTVLLNPWLLTPVFLSGEFHEQRIQSMGSRRVGHDRLSSFFIFFLFKGFPGGPSGKEFTCQCRRHKTGGFHPWAGKIPWRQAWKLTPGFLPGETRRQRSLAGYGLWGHKELARTEQLRT